MEESLISFLEMILILQRGKLSNSFQASSIKYSIVERMKYNLSGSVVVWPPERIRMAAVSMMSSQEGGLTTDFSPEDDGFFTCAVSVQHKVSRGGGKEWGGKSDKLRHCFNIQQGDRRGPNILNIHRWYESFWFQLVFWPGKIRCKSLKCDLSPEVKLSKIPFSVVLINDS